MHVDMATRREMDRLTMAIDPAMTERDSHDATCRRCGNWVIRGRCKVGANLDGRLRGTIRTLSDLVRKTRAIQA